MAGDNRGKAFREQSPGKLGKATGPGRAAKEAYKYGRGRMRARRPGGAIANA